MVHATVIQSIFKDQTLISNALLLKYCYSDVACCTTRGGNYNDGNKIIDQKTYVTVSSIKIVTYYDLFDHLQGKCIAYKFCQRVKHTGYVKYILIIKFFTANT